MYELTSEGEILVAFDFTLEGGITQREDMGVVREDGTYRHDNPEYPKVLIEVMLLVDGLLPAPAGMDEEKFLKLLLQRLRVGSFFEVEGKIAIVTGLLGGISRLPVWQRLLEDSQHVLPGMTPGSDNGG
jgi:hypothetical protein